MSARDQMIATGVEMFRREGYQACSWRKLVERAGTPWGSVTHYFPNGKEELGVAVVRRAAQLGALRFANDFSDDKTAAESIASIFRDSADQLKADKFEAGCPVAIVALERGSYSSALTEACAAAFEDWRRQIAEALERRGFEHERATEIALAVLVTLEGCLVIARAAGSTEAFGAGLKSLLATLGDDRDALPVLA